MNERKENKRKENKNKFATKFTIISYHGSIAISEIQGGHHSHHCSKGNPKNTTSLWKPFKFSPKIPQALMIFPIFVNGIKASPKSIQA